MHILFRVQCDRESRNQNRKIDTTNNERGTWESQCYGDGFSPQSFNYFQLFPSKQNSESCRTESEQVRNGPDENKGGCRWFQLFFIDLQLFYYLFKIIHDIKFFITPYTL